MTRKKRVPNKTYPFVCVRCGTSCLARKAPPPALCPKCTHLKWKATLLEKEGVTPYSKWVKHNPEHKKKTRARSLLRLYNLTPEAYERLLSQQAGVCAICKKSPLPNGVLVVDHDHKTGKVRGLLCHGCNRAIGALQDDLGVLRSASTYLLRHDPRRSWDSYFMQIAEVVATRSKDPSTQVGAVLVRDRHIIATGYNGFPAGVNDNVPERWDRPAKYIWIAHAEENCIGQVARYGSRALGATLFVSPLPPCAKCALIIATAGIKEVVVPEGVADSTSTRWSDSLAQASAIMRAAKVLVRPPE